jgi:hypothetical protein
LIAVAALQIGGRPASWRGLGFEVIEGSCPLGGVRLDVSDSVTHGAIVSWTVDRAEVPDSIDGLRTVSGARNGAAATHPNGVTSIDHLVALTPSLERTAEALAQIGVECRRVREAGDGVRQGFFLVGDLLLEVVARTAIGEDEPARFWGITVVVPDIDAAAELLGEKLGSIRDAVQPGRRIATVRPEASDGLPLALITPRG